MSDKRVSLLRNDLAPAAMDGVARSARFDETTAMRTVVATAPLRAAPDAEAEQVDQLLFGEMFDVLKTEGGFAWGQARRDGYVGWVDLSAVSKVPAPPSHWIGAIRAFAFAEPSIKASARGPFSLNALVAVETVSGDFALAADAGWIPRTHLLPIGLGFAEPADMAQRFLGAPYLWGGRDSLGLDCSGLVQQALYAAGRSAPRDADQQAALGAPAPADHLRRGDLVAWRGHIGMMLDGARLIHANAHHMAVAIEPLAEAVSRIAAAGSGYPTAYRRL